MIKITTAVVLLIGAVSMGLGWAGYQAAATPEAPLSRDVPSGALLYLQVKDLSALLADWNGSPQKQAWLGSSNYEVFSRSRLLLRLNDAGKQFATAAGLPPDMNFMSQVAGSESALALYDIGKLQFIYVTRLPTASAMQNQLWQTRAKFETRSAAEGESGRSNRSLGVCFEFCCLVIETSLRLRICQPGLLPGLRRCGPAAFVNFAALFGGSHFINLPMKSAPTNA